MNQSFRLSNLAELGQFELGSDLAKFDRRLDLFELWSKLGFLEMSSEVYLSCQ